MTSESVARARTLKTLGALELKLRAAKAAHDEPLVIETLDSMLAAGAVTGLHGFAAMLWLEKARAYGRVNQQDAALNAVTQAAQLGFADAQFEWTGDLAALKSAPKAGPIAAQIRHNSITQRVYVVSRWENPSLGQVAEHRFDDFSGPDYEALLSRPDVSALKAATETLDTQLAVQLAALDWVHRRWAHSGLLEPPAPRALAILEAVDNGGRFRCVEYSIVLAQVLGALGYPARVLGLRRDGMSFGTGKGHVVTEVWNDDLQQWILLDGQNNAVWFLSGKPASAHALQTAFHRSQPDLELRHQGSNWLPRPPAVPVWAAYFHAIDVPVDARISSAPSDRKMRLMIQPGQMPELLFQGMGRAHDVSANEALLSPKLNGVHVRLETLKTAPTSGRIDAHLTHSTPSFSHYEVNGQAWHAGDPFPWRLKPGNNRLEIRSVNKRGIKGRVTAIEIEFHAP